MENTFVLKNIKNDLNRTESEHENIGKVKKRKNKVIVSDGIGGTIKNVVFRQVKSGRVIINSAEEFSVAANKFVPLIATLFQKEKDFLCKPDYINQSPSILATL